MKTQIVCTIGPSCWKYPTLQKMADAGMKIARINLSHSDINFFKKIASNLKKITNHNISIMADTKGPEIRICPLKKPLAVKTNDIITIQTKILALPNKSKSFSVYDSTGKYNMANDLKVNHRIAVDDGKLWLRVVSINLKKDEIKTKVLNDYIINSNKRINLPDSSYSIPFLSQKDIKDLQNSIKIGAKYIALSFVCNAQNIKDARKIIAKAGGKNIKVYAKIETQDSLNNLVSIIKEADGIMIARGDLALETPYYNIPYWETKIIKMCKKSSKPVIVCTQMLDSLEKNIYPTRAEVTDVYYAASMNADGVMLSGETANGCNPVNAVKIMQTIINAAYEKSITK